MVRLKNRYILFEILYPPAEQAAAENIVIQHRQQRKENHVHITSKMIVYELKKMIKLYAGDQGLAKANIMLQMKYFNSDTSMGIIKCSFEFYKVVVLGLSMIQHVSTGGENGASVERMMVNVLKLGGTIKKLEEFGIQRNKNLIKRIDFRQRKNSSLSSEKDVVAGSVDSDFLRVSADILAVRDDANEG